MSQRKTCRRCEKAPMIDGRHGVCAPCYEVLHGKWCAFCGPARNPDKLTNGQHKLFLVASGTTWHLWWALNREQCSDQVRAMWPGRSPFFRVRRATGVDLQALRDIARAASR